MFSKGHRPKLDGALEAVYNLFCGLKAFAQVLKHFNIDDDVVHRAMGAFFCDVEMLAQLL